MKNLSVSTRSTASEMIEEAGEKLKSSHKMLADLFTVAFDKPLDPQLPSHQQRIVRLWPVVSEMVNAAFLDLDEALRLIRETEFDAPVFQCPFVAEESEVAEQ